MSLKRNKVRLLLIIIAACLFSYTQPASVDAVVYYVDSNGGNDTNDGLSSASAWERFSTSVPKLNDGDILRVAAGIYDLANEGDPADNVTIGNSNISIIGDSSGITEIDGTDFSDWFDGITIESNFDNIVIENIKIKNFERGIVIGDRCENVVIESCNIGPNSTNGISVTNCSPEIKNNTLVDNLTGIYIYGYMDGTTSASPTITNNLIYEETSNAMNYGIFVEGLATDGDAYPLIYHNTIDGGSIIGVYMNEDVSPIEPTIKYNIITDFGQYGVGYSGGNNPVVDYNHFFGNTSGNYSGDIIAGSNNITGQDPLFEDPSAHDYHLQTGSPSIDAIPSTETGNDVGIDLEYNTRTFPKDMGCYEVVQETPPSDSRPDTPTNISPDDYDVISDATTGVTLEGSPFSDPDGNTHASTEWRVKREDRGVYNCDDYDASFNATYTSGAGLTSHDVQGLAAGMQYVWQVRYQNSNGNWSLWSEGYRFAVGASARDSSVELQGGTDLVSYRMVSFPLWPDDNLCVRFFFDELGDGAYDTTRLRLGTYDTETGAYVECGSGMTIKPGRSYWFLSKNDLGIDVNGIPVATDLDVEIGLQYDTVTGNGWNMIACPNNADYDWASVEVLIPDASGGTIFGPAPISDLADDNPYIDVHLWRWEGGSYYDDTQNMVHHEGYWVNARAENVYLKFRADMAVTDSGSNPTMVSRAFTRIKKWISAAIDTRHAVASGETPPLPPGAHDEPETKSCFISAVFN